MGLLDTVKKKASEVGRFISTIIPRSFEKDWSPKDPRLVMPRMRQVVAFNNNR